MGEAEAVAGDLLAQAQSAQANASDPVMNVFVSANAGSGKTKVLVDRVIRLLLAGAKPDAIVCITYTKAAAAEMRARLFAQLGAWTIAEDEALAASVHALTGVSAGGDLAAARRLFARALETPGGLRIQTIHAFCERVLRRFPLEAGAPPGFEVMEGAAAQRLANDAMDAVKLAAVDDPDGPMATAFSCLALTGMGAVDQLQRFALTQRAAVLTTVARAGGLESALTRLAKALGVPANADPDQLIAQAWADTNTTHLAQAREALALGSKTDQAKASAIAAALHASQSADGHAAGHQMAGGGTRAEDTRAAGRAALAAYRKVFFTKDGTGPLAKSIATKPVRAAHAWLGPFLDREAERLLAHDVQVKGAQTLALSAAGLRIATAFLHHYTAAKRARSVLDFGDLVEKTNQLLSSSAAAAWVLYKLDGGVSHVLVDEAQDTSPEQWTLVNALTNEFFAGDGVERPEQDLVRTLFAVGDEKQSIYGFQGADPAQFLHAGQRLSAHAPGQYRGVDLPVSFRSAPAVLRAVDAVFGQPGVAERLTPRGDMPRHQAQRSDCPGRVEVWPLVPEPPKSEPEDPWSVSAVLPEGKGVDAPPAGSPDLQLARLIASTVRQAIAAGELVSERQGRQWVRRPMRAGDVMVLVRQRGAIFEHMIRELKAAGLPVAGADRMVLAEQTVVQDIVRVARVALLPEDDLALAELLKSPFFHPVGCAEPPVDDMALFDLAHNRSDTLWAALQASDDSRFAPARDFVRDVLARVSVETPFAFLSGVLDLASPTGESYAARLFARLGVEAEDPAREVLDRALAHSRGHGGSGLAGAGAPALDRFVLDILSDAGAIKRDTADPRDEVRVMTVHGAKGLEAPMVICPDAGLRAEAQFPNKDDGMRAGGVAGLMWSPRKADDPPAAETLRSAALDAAIAEDLRLLYVAMTRAQDTLIVCGGGGRSRGGPNSWHGRVVAGLEALEAEPFASPVDALTQRGDGDHAQGDAGAGAGSPNADGDEPPDGLRLGHAPQHEQPPQHDQSPEHDPAPQNEQAPHDTSASAHAETSAIADDAYCDIPSWARMACEPPVGGAAHRRLSPSTLLSDGDDTDSVASPLSAGAPDRFRRGNLIHALLETLPDLPAEKRSDAAAAWLARQGVDAAEAAVLVAETMRVLTDPEFAVVFGPGSRAEVALMGSGEVLRTDFGGRFGDGAVLDGRVDRLAVTEDGVWVVDYKTNRPPPRDPALVDPAYIAQLAAYRAVLGTVYPGRTITCALLWTFTATLMPIPDAMMDASLAPV